MEMHGGVTAPVRLDDNRWYCRTQELQSGYLTSFSLLTLTYSNAYIHEKTLTCADNNCSVYRVASNEIKYITKPDDLKNMSGRCYYELKNDIDLSGIEWHGERFEGVFNGKGYAIKNLSFVGTVKNTSAFLGLFSEGDGIIENLNMKEVTVIASITCDEGEGRSGYCGAIVAYGSALKLNNCTVDEYSTLSVRNTNPEVYINISVGGLVGCFEWSETMLPSINNCTNHAGVNGNMAGGMVGDFSRGTITNCTNTGDISGAHAGGMAGNISGTATVDGCTNSGNITAATENIGMGGTSAVYFAVVILVGVNFLVEFAANVILAPTIASIVKAVRKVN
jgi:hypothetical protein